MAKKGTSPAVDQEDGKDPYELQAEAQKKAQAAKPKKKPQKEMPSVKNRNRKIIGKSGKPRPCGICKTVIAPIDPRTKYCPDCGKQVAAEAARIKGGRKPLSEDEVRSKLRPWLKMGLNLKQACYEAEVSYATVCDKKKTWEGFDEFVA